MFASTRGENHGYNVFLWRPAARASASAAAPAAAPSAAPASSPSTGVVSIDGLTVTGTSDRSGLYVHYYADVNGMTLNDVDLSGLTSSAAPATAVADNVRPHSLEKTPCTCAMRAWPCGCSATWA